MFREPFGIAIRTRKTEHRAVTTDFTFAWPATFTADADGHVSVVFPDLPEARTDGADLDEALAEAAGCHEPAIAARIAGREDIPRPLPLPDDGSARLVTCPAPTAQKAALALALRAAGIGNVALAATLGIDEKDVRRMLDLHHSRPAPTGSTRRARPAGRRFG